MVRLLLLTAQRRTEVAAAQWSEFDLRDRLWSIPRERMKAAAVHDVALTEDVIELLRHLPRVPSSDYLFPAIRGDGYNVAYKKAKSRLARASGVTDWVLHDFRRTAATRMQGLGFRLEVIEDVLGHVSGSRRGVVGIYQRHRFKDEKRDALEAWAQYLRHVIRPARPKGKLVLLRDPSGP